MTPTTRRALVEAHHHGSLADPGAYVAWFESQFNHYLKAYASPTLRPLAEALIEICKAQFGPDDPITARALTNLARNLLQLGERAQAEPLLQRAISV